MNMIGMIKKKNPIAIPIIFSTSIGDFIALKKQL